MTDPQIVTAEEAAALVAPKVLAQRLGVPEKTLAEWRSRGIGPKYLRIGRYARYRQSDVETWLVSQERLTS